MERKIEMAKVIACMDWNNNWRLFRHSGYDHKANTYVFEEPKLHSQARERALASLGIGLTSTAPAPTLAVQAQSTKGIGLAKVWARIAKMSTKFANCLRTLCSQRPFAKNSF